MDLAPDEYMRYDVPLYIVNHGSLPLGSAPEIRNELWGTSYGFSVYGSSLVASVFMAMARAFGGNEAVVLVAARFASVLFASGTVALCFPLGARFLKRASSVSLFSVLVGFLPQFAFLASYFNSDTMEVFSTALVLLCLVRGVDACWSWRSCIELGLAIGVCALSYYYGYGVILASVFVYYASAAKLGSSAGAPYRRYAVKPLAILGCALLVAGWFFVRNALLYDGDIFGMKTSSAMAEAHAASGYRPQERITIRGSGVSLFDALFVDGALFDSSWLHTTVRSFFGIFGYMTIPIGDTTLRAYEVIVGVGAAGGVAVCVMRRRWLALFTALFVMAVPVVLSIYYSWSSDYQAQGRYLIAGLVPLMLLVSAGWELVSDLPAKMGRRREARRHERLLDGSDDQGMPAQGEPALSLARDGVILAVAAIWLLLGAWVAYSVVIPLCTGPVL